MNPVIQERITAWLNGNFDNETKEAIKKLQASSNSQELEEAFYQNLEFGTGGLRGVMGVGTNRMNKYTVGMATQGFANYLKKCFPAKKLSIAISHDSRNNSRFFAETTAHVFAANDIEVYLFEALRPTPELSYTIRELKLDGGVMCTASHNPKEYNGYKAYWNDGAQLVAPHDVNIIKEVEAIKNVNEVKWNGNEDLIHLIGEDIDEKYIKMVLSLSVNPQAIKSQHDLKIVYTPLHGTGITLIPKVLERLGFTNVNIVKEQSVPDGNFPTVVYPNPEESSAMKLGLNLAEEIDADILLGTDPDADRVAVGVKNHKGQWVLLNGNQTAIIAISYVLEARRERGLATKNDMVVSTIVTTEMIHEISRQNAVAYYDVLTGFKWIADKIREKEGKEKYIIGGEESFGLMIGDQVRDKDAISAVSLICEMAAGQKAQGYSLYERLINLYIKYGFYLEKLISITKKGIDGHHQINEMMEGFRNNPPKTIAGSSVIKVKDYESGVETDLRSGDKKTIELPKSNVLQFYLEDGSKISARPSGTEPKIKFYFSVNCPLESKDKFDETYEKLQQRISSIITDMKLD